MHVCNTQNKTQINTHHSDTYHQTISRLFYKNNTKNQQNENIAH